MKRDRLDITSWLLRIFGWDGLIPLAMMLAARAIQQLPKGIAPTTELIAIALPSIAIVIRLYAGAKTISQNHCSPSVRLMQLATLVITLFVLGVAECVLILSPLAPPGKGPFDHPKDRIIWLYVLTAYTVAISFAMYPGRRWITEDDSDPLHEMSETESPWL